MRDYIFVTDTSANLGQKKCDELGVRLLSMHYFMDDKDYLADNDWKTIPAKDFYDIVRSGKRIMTSQVDQPQVEECFKKILDEGKDVIYIACSGALSSTVLEAQRARDALLEQEKYKEAKIAVIDSVCACFTQAMLLFDALRLKNEGKSFEEVVEFAENNKRSYLETGYANELKYLRQAGRVSAAAAFFGDIIGIRPIIIFNTRGYNVAVEKKRGKRAALSRCAEMVKEFMIKDEHHKTIYLAHADCKEDVDAMIEAIKEKLQDDSIEFGTDYINVVIGACVGPGTIIVGFYGDPNTRIQG